MLRKVFRIKISLNISNRNMFSLQFVIFLWRKFVFLGKCVRSIRLWLPYFGDYFTFKSFPYKKSEHQNIFPSHVANFQIKKMSNFIYLIIHVFSYRAFLIQLNNNFCCNIGNYIIFLAHYNC